MWPAELFLGTFVAPSAVFIAFSAPKLVWVWYACFRSLDPIPTEGLKNYLEDRRKGLGGPDLSYNIIMLSTIQC